MSDIEISLKVPAAAVQVLAAQVKAGAFYPLILQGDLEGIKQAVTGQLAGRSPG